MLYSLRKRGSQIYQGISPVLLSFRILYNVLHLFAIKVPCNHPANYNLPFFYVFASSLKSRLATPATLFPFGVIITTVKEDYFSNVNIQDCINNNTSIRCTFFSRKIFLSESKYRFDSIRRVSSNSPSPLISYTFFLVSTFCEPIIYLLINGTFNNRVDA